MLDLYYFCLPVGTWWWTCVSAIKVVFRDVCFCFVLGLVTILIWIWFSLGFVCVGVADSLVSGCLIDCVRMGL